MADIKRSTTRRIKGIASLLLSALTTWSVSADDFADGIDRNDPNFIRASVLMFSPGNELFSCAGHACLRLECPTFNLDYCFSYESERVIEKLPRFFAGNLKMGLFAIPTDEFLEDYRRDGRGARQYKLNLPPKIKQRLWKVLDDRAAQGANLPYDYIKRGCAWSVLHCLIDGLNPLQIEPGPWPEKFRGHQRAIIASALDDFPWARFFIHAIVGADVDRDIPNIRKVVVPADFLAFMQTAKINGEPIIIGDGVELLPTKVHYKPPLITPLLVAWFWVILAIANCFWSRPYGDWLFLGVQSLAGCFFMYLVGLSHLPATSWNWLIVPFNLFPLILWRFRRWWAWPMVAILVVWDGAMLFYPHQLTDPAYIVLVLAYIIFYVKICFSVSHSLPRQNHPPGNSSRVGSCFVRL